MKSAQPPDRKISECSALAKAPAAILAPLPYNAISTVHSARAILTFALLASSLFAAADKKLPIEETTNDLLTITATATLDRDQIKQELGYDLGPDIALVHVTLHTVSDKPIQVSHDDFLLISSKDGQRSQPYEPGQIAGADSLTVTESGAKQATRKTGLMIGGLGGGIGNGGSSAQNPDLKVQASHDDNPNPLLAVLTAKILPEKEITDTVSGLLYFQMVGKLKPKDLELHYKGPAGRLALRFKP
ncbi:MAG: hypothetical protein ABSH31_18290 [Bryobacteraceae bacterium]|jgi:hypothetical protein